MLDKHIKTSLNLPKESKEGVMGGKTELGIS